MPWASTTASKQFQNLLQAFPMVFLFESIKAAVNITFSWSLLLHRIFFLPFNRTSHITIKMIALWCGGRPQLRGDMVTENFQRAKTDFFCLCDMVRSRVARRRVFQQPTSRSWLPQPCSGTCRFCVVSETMCEDEWRHNITIASDHPKHYDVDLVFRFHLYRWII